MYVKQVNPLILRSITDNEASKLLNPTQTSNYDGLLAYLQAADDIGEDFMADKVPVNFKIKEVEKKINKKRENTAYKKFSMEAIL